MDMKEDFAEEDLRNFTLEFEFLKEEEEALAEVLPELVAEQPKKKRRFLTPQKKKETNF